MAWPLLAIAAVGVGTQVFGGYKATMDEANAEVANANFYREQAAFAEATKERELRLFDKESAIFESGTLSKIVKSGGSMTAADIGIMASNRIEMRKERDAINKEGNFRTRLANLRAQASMQRAGDLREGAPLQAFGTLMGGASRILAAGA